MRHNVLFADVVRFGLALGALLIGAAVWAADAMPVGYIYAFTPDFTQRSDLVELQTESRTKINDLPVYVRPGDRLRVLSPVGSIQIVFGDGKLVTVRHENHPFVVPQIEVRSDWRKTFTRKPKTTQAITAQLFNVPDSQAIRALGAQWVTAGIAGSDQALNWKALSASVGGFATDPRAPPEKGKFLFAQEFGYSGPKSYVLDRYRGMPTMSPVFMKDAPGRLAWFGGTAPYKVEITSPTNTKLQMKDVKVKDVSSDLRLIELDQSWISEGWSDVQITDAQGQSLYGRFLYKTDTPGKAVPKCPFDPLFSLSIDSAVVCAAWSTANTGQP